MITSTDLDFDLQAFKDADQAHANALADLAAKQQAVDDAKAAREAAQTAADAAGEAEAAAKAKLFADVEEFSAQQ